MLVQSYLRISALVVCHPQKWDSLVPPTSATLQRPNCQQGRFGCKADSHNCVADNLILLDLTVFYAKLVRQFVFVTLCGVEHIC